jgi:hypothetical protein
MGRRHSPRVKAAAAGERFYEGQICPICGGTQRYVAQGNCVACMRGPANHDGRGNHEAPPCPAALAERDARSRLVYVESFEQRYWGDPPPGRSALDRMKASPRV